MGDLTTLANVKRFAGLSNDEHNARLSLLISAVSEELERYCQRRLSDTTISLERAVGYGVPELLLAHEPRTVTLVTDGGVTVSSTEYALDQDTWQSSRILRRVSGSWGRGTEFVVTYTTGFALGSMPKDLEGACIAETIRAFNRFAPSGKGTLGLHQQILDGGGTAVFEVGEGLLSATRSVLERWRRRL